MAARTATPRMCTAWERARAKTCAWPAMRASRTRTAHARNHELTHVLDARVCVCTSGEWRAPEASRSFRFLPRAGAVLENGSRAWTAAHVLPAAHAGPATSACSVLALARARKPRASVAHAAHAPSVCHATIGALASVPRGLCTWSNECFFLFARAQGHATCVALPPPCACLCKRGDHEVHVWVGARRQAPDF